tara:strand:+ start:327 stop:617 length:291 start_codon:yes stop_codon:yes gene_type:complete
MNKKELEFKNAMVSDDEKKVFESLMEAFFNGLASFVFDNKMQRGIEILHKFNASQFVDDNSPSPVRIIIAKEDMTGVYDKVNEEYIWPERNIKNIN